MTPEAKGAAFKALSLNHIYILELGWLKASLNNYCSAVPSPNGEAASTHAEGATENRKRVIRKKAAKFVVEDGMFFYKMKKDKVCVFTWPQCTDLLRLLLLHSVVMCLKSITTRVVPYNNSYSIV